MTTQTEINAVRLRRIVAGMPQSPLTTAPTAKAIGDAIFADAKRGPELYRSLESLGPHRVGTALNCAAIYETFKRKQAAMAAKGKK